jgi:hypothetical protein
VAGVGQPGHDCAAILTPDIVNVMGQPGFEASYRSNRLAGKILDYLAGDSLK